MAPGRLTAAVSLAAELEPWSTRASAVLTHELRSRGSWAVGHRFSGCGVWAQLSCDTWDLPRAGIEPLSPALATEPPGKPRILSLLSHSVLMTIL